VDRAFGFQQVVQGRWFDGASRQTVEMREGDFVAEAIVFLGFYHLPVFGGVAAETAWIVVAHGYICRPVHHPAGEFAG